MYHKYLTEGIVVKSFDRGEVDRVYSVFTREFGLIYADAKGIRKEGSKLRGALQDYTYSTITLVRTKERWRITDAEVRTATWHALAQKDKRDCLLRILRLTSKLLAVEDPHSAVFDTIVHGILFLSRMNPGEIERANLEVLLALRVLNHLGYLGESKSLRHILVSPFINDIHIFEAGRLRKQALSEINRSIRELPL